MRQQDVCTPVKLIDEAAGVMNKPYYVPDITLTTLLNCAPEFAQPIFPC